MFGKLELYLCGNKLKWVECVFEYEIMDRVFVIKMK